MKQGIIELTIAIVLLAGMVRTAQSACVEGEPCESSSGSTGICLGGICITEIPNEERRNLSFTIIVKYPEEKLSGGNLYVRGNGLGLNWQSGEPLTKTSADTWEKTVFYKNNYNGFFCEECLDQTAALLSNQKFEYRILIDDIRDMIGANFAVELPVSKAALSSSQTPRFEVYPWFNELHGTTIKFSIYSEKLQSERKIGLYLPPSFHENTYKTYGALLVYDLSQTFVEILKVDVFDKYMAESGIGEETILIGWGDFNQTERTALLTPVPGISFGCINGTLENRCDDCYPEGLDSAAWLEAMRDRCGFPYTEGGQGDLGLDFFIDEALPKAAELAEGRLLSDREHLGIMGYSLGGLMSCHAAWTRPERFGYAACQSSSFYWPMDANAQMGFHFHNVSLKDPQLLQERKPQKIYIDVGGLESGAPYYQDLGAIEAADFMGETGFFKSDENVWFQYYPSHPHTSLHWIMRVWSPISVLFPPKGTPTRVAMLEKLGRGL